MKKGEIIMWGLILGSALAAAVVAIIYLTGCIGKFGAIQALAGERKWLRRLISFLILAGICVLLGYFMSPVNAVIVMLHEAVFFLLFGVIIRLISHFSGKEFTVNWQGWLAVICSIVYLGYGYYALHHVSRTDYTLKTDKQITLKAALIADSHLSTVFDADGFAEHLKTIEAQQPDLLLIAGDFVDDSTKNTDLMKACEALGKLDLKYGVWYCYGNHDKGYYRNKDYTPDELEKALKDNGVHVLTDAYELVDDSFYIVGRNDRSRSERKSMEDLLEGVDTSKYIIVMDHQPSDYENEAASAADLVVSGHTHGGQLIPITFVGEWLSMNNRTYGYEQRSGTDFIVTSGIADWEIQFKTGTKSEYVMINIGG
ncbi:MAG: metallophosphoesterase [Oscillospiraceae bacterium]|nr:metallophosphoesterase [Oscillospiraceae bacterium]